MGATQPPSRCVCSSRSSTSRPASRLLSWGTSWRSRRHLVCPAVTTRTRNPKPETPKGSPKPPVVVPVASEPQAWLRHTPCAGTNPSQTPPDHRRDGVDTPRGIQRRHAKSPANICSVGVYVWGDAWQIFSVSFFHLDLSKRSIGSSVSWQAHSVCGLGCLLYICSGRSVSD